jgi:regulator of protease activity HflC (stomatin/prohibitin superfamily)
MNVADMLRGLATLSWIVAIAVIALGVARAARGHAFKGAAGIVAGTIVAAILLTSVAMGLVFVRPEQRGVVLSAVAPGGYRTEALAPGLHWVIPFFESVVVYPIWRQTYTMSVAPVEGAIQGDDSIAARTADGQEIFVDASVIFAIDPAEVVQVHIDWQDRYPVELVRPQVRGIIRDQVSRYGVEEVVSTRRIEMTDGVRAALAERLTENGLVLVDFILRNITFSPEYAASVEQKQIAEQQAQQAAFVVEQRRQEAEQARQVAQGQADAAVIAAEGRAEARLIEAEAEAQALEMIAAALADNPDLLTYQYITKLAPGIQVMLVPNNAPYLLPLPTLEPAPTPTP